MDLSGDVKSKKIQFQVHKSHSIIWSRMTLIRNRRNACPSTAGVRRGGSRLHRGRRRPRALCPLARGRGLRRVDRPEPLGRTQ